MKKQIEIKCFAEYNPNNSSVQEKILLYDIPIKTFHKTVTVPCTVILEIDEPELKREVTETMIRNTVKLWESHGVHGTTGCDDFLVERLLK